MTEAEAALAREAVACKHWEWMPGMRAVVGNFMWRVCGTGGGLRGVGDTHPGIGYVPLWNAFAATSDALPAFCDPGTAGCLENLVQRVLGHDGVDVVVEARWAPATGYRVVRWRSRGPMGWTPATVGGEGHPSKVAALVAALKAAP